MREPLLGPVDRVSEMLFGLFMALTFVGAVGVIRPGGDEVREMVAAAFGCNIAWGLVDGVMYLVRTMADRGRTLSLALAVRAAPTPAEGGAIVARALSSVAAQLVSGAEIEAVRKRIVALESLPARAPLRGRDVLAALCIFLIVVASTVPVVLPFLVIGDASVAKTLSRVVALAMLFGGGVALGRHAGHVGLRTGFMMTGVGVALVAAIMALGG